MKRSLPQKLFDKVDGASIKLLMDKELLQVTLSIDQYLNYCCENNIDINQATSFLIDKVFMSSNICIQKYFESQQIETQDNIEVNKDFQSIYDGKGILLKDEFIDLDESIAIVADQFSHFYERAIEEKLDILHVFYMIMSAMMRVFYFYFNFDNDTTKEGKIK